MDEIYQNPQGSTSSEALLEEKNDHDHIPIRQVAFNLPISGNDKPRESHLRRVLNIATTSILYFLAIYGLFSSISHVIRFAPNPSSENSIFQIQNHIPVQALNDSSHDFEPRCHCGNSTAEAKARGCKLDMLAAAWLPPHCIDEELSAQFDRSGPGPNGEWPYYNGSSTDNYTVEISMETIEFMGDDPHARIYTNWDWHILHCMFYWKKMWRADMTGTTIEGRYDNEGHINHCAKALVGERGWDTTFRIVFNT